MSLINFRESSNPWTEVESCGHHQEQQRRRRYRCIFIVSGLLVGLLGLTIFIVYLVLQPHNPRFVLEDFTICDNGNDTSSANNLLARTLQVTVSSRNPNDRVGVVYDKLNVYASYRDRQFTNPTALPPSYLGTHNDVVEWAPFLYGAAVTLTPDLAASFEQDLTAGTVLLDVKVRGRMRWKVGMLLSTRYHVFVTCPVHVMLAKESDGVAVGQAAHRNGVVEKSGTTFRSAQSCSLTVSIG